MLNNSPATLLGTFVQLFGNIYVQSSSHIEPTQCILGIQFKPDIWTGKKGNISHCKQLIGGPDVF